MSKLQKCNSGQLHLNINTPTSQHCYTSQQTSINSPKPPIAQKSFKTQKGDSSFRVISPKFSSNKSNSQRSMSKNSSPLEKQMSMPDTYHFEDSQNDAVIETTHIMDETVLPHINKELTAIEDQISNAKLIDMNAHVLKQWQSELLKFATRLISINNKMIMEQPLNIASPRQRCQTNDCNLEDKLMEEQKKRLAAEEQSSKVLQDQEKQIELLNSKLFKLEQQYSQKCKQ